jgi:hypothetical protein
VQDGSFTGGYRVFIAPGHRPAIRTAGNFGRGWEEFIGPSLEPGRPHHVVFTYEETTLTLFVDGELTNSWTMPRFVRVTSPMTLGSGLKGVLDEVAFYTHPLSAASVNRHFIVGQISGSFPPGSCGGVCAANEQVRSRTCQPCPMYSVNAAGDDPSGSDTRCDFIVCAADQRVAGHACAACPQGTTRLPGDLISEPDTTCSPPSTGYAAAVANAGPSARWRLDESAGLLVDQLGGPAGVATGSATDSVTYARPGLVAPGTALSFNGGMVEVPFSAGSNPTGSGCHGGR